MAFQAPFRSTARAVAALTSALLVSSLIVLTAGGAAADTAPPAGVPATVSADPLPTVQIDGVAWDQVVVGNTVYVTGSFAYARPAGTPANSASRVARANLLAYDITTGNLITGFNHSLNGQGRGITASPDGSRLYVVGEFTTVDGIAHNRIAAFNTATGALVSTFNASLNNTAQTVTASNSAVYVGGRFTTANGSGRNRLAAYTAAGGLLPWNPGASAVVTSMVLSPDGSRVVVGGGFVTLAGASRLGIGSVLTSSGAAGTWPADFPIKDYGSSSNITSLTADGSNVYGTGYYYTSGGNFEGRFAVNPNDGQLIWMNTCHGDSYDSTPIGGVLYSAGHQHDCSDIGSFSQDDPQPIPSTHYYVAAETTAATGRLIAPVFLGGQGGPTYYNFAGQPSGTQLQYYPTYTPGSYTGQGQAAWSVAGNSNYLSVGGEFPTANGTAQQGLVRYAVRSIAPNRIGPANVTAPTAISHAAGSLRVGWRAASDPDNAILTYDVLRDGGTTPIYSTTFEGSFWKRPALGFTDTGVAAGTSHTYRIRVTDPTGNSVTSTASAPVTVGTTDRTSYSTMIRADGAANFWPLTESGGSTGFDNAGYADLTARSGVTFGATPGPIPGGGTAATFSGAVISTPGPNPNRPPTITSNSVAATAANALPLATYSLEAWVRTTSTTGGAILSDSLYTPDDGQLSPTMDRVLYLTNDGTPRFGLISNNTKQSIGSTAPVNDGNWHLINATAGPAGAVLYVDGVQVAADAALRESALFVGHWRLGGDSFAGWSNPPTSGFLGGAIANAAVYPAVLSASRVQAHFAAAGTTPPPANVDPVARITSSCAGLVCSFNGGTSTDSDGTIDSYAWNFGDSSTETGAAPSHTYVAPGTYQVNLRVTDNAGGTDDVTTNVTVTATPPANVAPTASFTSSCTALSCSFNGAASSDSDGTIAGYAWNFGDSTSGTGSTSTHAYGTAGTYTVTLTVTDDDGATGAVSQTVTPTAAPPANTPFATDTFNRTVTSGFGTADLGGAWTVAPTARFAVSGGTGRITLATAGAGTNAYLGSTSATSTDLTVGLALDKVPTATAYLDIVGRRVGTNQEYDGLVQVTSTGAVQVNLRKLDGTGTAVNVGTLRNAGITYTPGLQLNARLQVTGTSPTTLALKVWRDGSPEPAAWTVTATDNSAALQAAGSVGLRSYLSSSATNAPIVQTVRAFSAKPVG